MGQLYCALAESVNLASINLVKIFQPREKYLTGWNRYCKNLHDDARNKFLSAIEMTPLELVKLLREWKPHDQPLKKTLKLRRRKELRLKKETIPAKLKTKKSNFLGGRSSENQK